MCACAGHVSSHAHSTAAAAHSHQGISRLSGLSGLVGLLGLTSRLGHVAHGHQGLRPHGAVRAIRATSVRYMLY